MSKKGNWKVQLLPRVVTDVDSIILWGIGTRLQLIREIACGIQNPGIGKPRKEEGMPEFLRLVASDWKADGEAVVEYMRAEVRNWWQDFTERELLSRLYRRAALRMAESGPLDARRPPSHEEGLRVAKPLLDDIQKRGPLDSEWESASVSTILALLLLPPIGVHSQDTLLEYIERSEDSRAYFDALGRIYKELDSRGEAIPRPLFGWQQGVDGGRRRRPAMKPRPSHRPVNPAFLLSNVQILFTIAILQVVGVKPRGRDLSGCRIVSEATGIPEETVITIWKQRNKPFASQMQKHWKAIAERNGPFHSTEG